MAIDDEHRAQARYLAWKGLVNGDLAGLRDFIRQGYDIDRELAADIADAIDGNHAGYQIKIHGRGRGHKGFVDKVEIQDRKIRIALFVERRKARAGRGQSDAIIAEAAQYFGVSAKTVEAVWTWWGRLERGEISDFLGCVQSVEEQYPNE